MKWVVPLLLAALAVIQFAAAAEDSSAGILTGLPACANSCLTTAISNSDCNLKNTTCVCIHQEIIGEASLCVGKTCSVKDSLTATNAININCHAPIRDKSQLFIDVTIILGTISAIFILLRIGSKFYITNSDFGLDDLFIVLTFCIGLPSTVMNVHGTAGHGEGKDIWTLDFDSITQFGLFFYILEVFYFAQVSFLKMSLLFFYLRIFLGPAQKWLWGTVIFNAIYGIAFVFLAAFQCQPISYFWTKWDGEHKGTCLNVNAIGWANASVSIALDVWMLAIPLWNLRKLNLHWKKKIGVAAMFVVGTFVTVVSIVRLQFLVDLGSSLNPTYDQTDVSIWSTVEINVGIVCASMPSLRILLVRLFPILGGSSHDSSKYRQYGEDYGRKSKIISRSHALVELPSRGDSVETPDHGGIELKRTFRVQYSDGDEASLVAQQGGFAKHKGPVTSAGLSGTSQSEVSL